MVLDLGPRVGVRVGFPLDVERSTFVGPLLGSELSGAIAPQLRLAAGLEVDVMPRDGLQLAVAASTVVRWHPERSDHGIGLGVEGGYWLHGMDRSFPASGGATPSTRAKLLQDSPFVAPVLVPAHLALGANRLELRAALVCSLYVAKERKLVVGDDVQLLRDGAFGPTAVTLALSWTFAAPLVRQRVPPS